MKSVCLILLLLCAKLVHAHEPDLSSLMVYQQNGKCFLVIKGSLTAFEGEVDYLFGKDAYKTPEAFQLLVIRHFQNNCLVMINDDTIRFNHPKVMLGHETTLFAELLNPPDKFNSIYVRNTLFKDMPANMCELIVTLNGLAQKQYILNNDNRHEVKLKVENNSWTVVKAANPPYKTTNLLFGVVFFVAASLIVLMAIRKKKNQQASNLSLPCKAVITSYLKTFTP